MSTLPSRGRSTPLFSGLFSGFLGEAPQGGRHRAEPAPSPVLAAAPRVIGAAALAVATTGAVSGATSYSGSATGGSGDLLAAEAAAASLVTTTVAAAPPAGAAAAGDAADTDRLDAAQVVGAEPQAARVPQMQVEPSVRLKRLEPRGSLGEDRLSRSGGRGEHAAPAPTWQLPLDAGTYRLTATFGQCSALWSSCHTGLDFAAPSGTPIKAIAGGVVTEAAYAGAYGNRTILRLEDGTELWYCHQTSFAVGVGQTVARGAVIGYVGSTGNSTGSHLHLEIRPGAADPVDPYGALAAQGVTP